MDETLQSEIQIIKLMSGEEIIGELTHVGNFLSVERPCQIVLQDAGGGRVNLQYYPIALAAKDQTIVVKPDGFIWFADPSPEALGLYKKRYSKIVTPDQKLVVAK